MTQVKSPYNFVPLNTRVFFPYWSKFVSHDLPFKKGLSGKIKLKIKTHTPIFIRGEKKVENGNDVYHFFKHNNKYCIPGTSIKGEIASVLENLSFAKIKDVNNSKYSIRDFNNSVLYKKEQFADSLGGFLYKNKDDENYYIKYNKEKPGRITHEQLDRDFKEISFVEKFKKEYDKKWDKSAKYKYDLFKKENLTISEFEEHYNSRGRIVYKKGTEKKGIIVFTGQASLRKVWVDKNKNIKKDEGNNTKGSGKHMEFIFWIPDKTVKVDEQVIKDFFFAYFDHEPKSQSVDWKYWKKKLDNDDKIPVFFMLENNEVKHLGLSQLYKLPYKYRVKDLIPDIHKKNDLDLIETIFGYTPDEEQKKEDYKELKGRVNVEPAYTNFATELNTVTTILGSPKASYYPFYIWQNPETDNITKDYNTYNDKNEIAGRKRYAVKKYVDVNHENSVPPSKTTVSFVPLSENTEFTTTIHYHNLLPVELGALLSALTFHNTKECHHSLGMAKPLGYGNVTFEIDFDKSDINSVASLKYMCMFEKMMDGFYKQEIDKNKEWIKSEQLKELFTMAKPLPSNHPKFTKLKYMILNDFARLKKRGNPPKALPRYSEFIGDNNFTVKPISLIKEKCDFNLSAEKEQYEINFSSLNSEIENYYNKQINTVLNKFQAIKIQRIY